MRCLLLILAAITGLILAATLFLWADSSDSYSIGLSTDYRGMEAPRFYFAGTHSYGLCATQDRIGWFYDFHISHGWEDASQIGTDQIPRQPTHFLFAHSAAPPLPDIYTEVLYSRFGYAVYADHDVSMGEVETDTTYVVHEWIVALVLAAVLGLILWRLGRTRRKLNAGLCPKCSYDIRTQLLGEGGRVCPECGTPIKPDSEQ